MIGSRLPGLGTAGLLVLLTAGCGSLSGGTTTAPPPAPTAGAEAQTGQRGGDQARPRSPRPYDRVITRNAVTRDGLFKTHLVDGKLFFEIPRSELGQGHAAAPAHGRRLRLGLRVLRRPVPVVVWEESNGKVVLRDRSFQMQVLDGRPSASPWTP
jgi:hypothetical protein